MMEKTYIEQNSLTDNLSPNGFKVIKRQNTKNYLVSFSIKGHGQIRKTLGTSDFESAYQRALKTWYEALHDFQHGRLHAQTTFATVADSYLAQLSRQVQQGQKSDVHEKDRRYLANRYFVPFFGEMKIGSISSKTMSDYLHWRTDYWFSPDAQRAKRLSGNEARAFMRRRNNPVRPKPTTLVRESVQLSHFFKHAIEQGYISAIPKCELPSAKLNPRPGFSVQEVTKIKDTSASRCFEEGLHVRVQNDRIKLHCYIMFAALSGMRVTEMANLRWSHIDIINTNKRSVTIFAHGKAKMRTLVPSSHIAGYIDVLQELFKQEVGRDATGNDPVFASSSASPIKSFRKGLDAVLDATGLLYDNKGSKRSAGSFRHFYITQMKRAGIDTDLLSLNVGTSPRMIQENYSKIKAVEEREKLDIDLLI